MIRASVIIPAFNRGYIVAEAIQSVLDQTYPYIQEIIVVDDGSTDDTADVVKSCGDPRIHLIQHPKNRGVAAARNTGLAEARGDLISFLDSDDLWATDKLALDAAFLANHPQADGVFADVRNHSDGYVTHSVVRTCIAFEKFLRSVKTHDSVVVPCRTMYLCMLQEMPIKIQATTFRREALKDNWKFDETWHSGEDWEFLLRFTRVYSLGFIDRPLVVQRSLPDSTFRRYQKADARSLIGLFSHEKNVIRGDPEANRALRKALTKYCDWLGNRCREDGELLESAKAYLKGFRETGLSWFLVKLLSMAIPADLRTRIKEFTWVMMGLLQISPESSLYPLGRKVPDKLGL
jgi:glycosyltransferase involved in cell wall biosynthesis